MNERSESCVDMNERSESCVDMNERSESCVDITEKLPPKEEKPKLNLDLYKFIRVIDPDHIPNYLVEQIRERDFDVDYFYQWQKANSVICRDGINIPNPYNHLWILVDDKRKTLGFFWSTIDTMSKTLFINNFSVDKSLWNRGEAIQLLKNKIDSIMKELKISKAYWTTKHAKPYEKYGFKRSKNILMEYGGNNG
jgi:hypothetical protein